MKNKNSWNQIKINFHSAFTTQCVSFTQSDSLTHPQGWRSQSQVHKICVSSKPWIRLCVSRHHHPPANNSSTTSHKIRLSVSASPLPPYIISISVCLSPPPYSIRLCLCFSCPHWSSTECSHGSPFCSQVPHFQQIHTQGLRENHNPSSTVCQHIPAPPFPHPQLPPFCKSQLTRDPPPPLFLHANFMAIREWIWHLHESNQGFSSGSCTS